MTRILIIDDDPDIRTVMNLSLKKHGYDVETASQKEEAFEKLENFKPDVILLDVLLSGSDGRNICREIKDQEGREGLPIIMVSAHPSAGENIRSYGADDFLGKPFTVDALLLKVANVLNRNNN
jgi:DNA-binding response OmpR family regulator